MCGIAGVCNLRNEEINLRVLKSMTEMLVHRGPDDSGHTLFDKTGFVELDTAENRPTSNCFFLGFGHRRLSIIDLSSAGHQPMSNEDQTVWITYNGEVYNYLEIRRILRERGHRFRSNTDTEVIIHAYEEWGTDCLERFIGMWAFALWDSRKRKLFCARDRLGIKPFYYYHKNGRFVFASEIKAILADDSVERLPNERRIYDYLAHGYLDHTEETLFRDIKQLRGGCFLIFDIQTGCFNVHRYWDIGGKEETWQKGERTYAEIFRTLFEDSVKLRLRSDVPVGTCLSGGLDSSSIVCMANRLLGADHRHKTFSSCFEKEEYDERIYIEAVVKKTGAESYRVFPDPSTLPGEMERLIWYQDEPFGSTSIFAQWNVFGLARREQTKVILDGQGADELLAGYHPLFGDFLADLLIHGRLLRTYREIQAVRSIHAYSLVWILSHMIGGLLKSTGRGFLASTASLGPRGVSWLRPVNDMGISLSISKKFGQRHLMNRLYHLVTAVSLPALLHYEDRNSMAHSIEARVPFLDHRLVEFVFSLPLDQIIRNGVTKVVLRDALAEIIPKRVHTRMDKIGFGTPEDIWFRTTLRDWVQGIIRSKEFRDRGFVDPLRVESEFNQHCAGKKNISFTIWRWVNLELWFRKFMGQTAV